MAMWALGEEEAALAGESTNHVISLVHPTMLGAVGNASTRLLWLAWTTP